MIWRKNSFKKWKIWSLFQSGEDEKKSINVSIPKGLELDQIDLKAKFL